MKGLFEVVVVGNWATGEQDQKNKRWVEMGRNEIVGKLPHELSIALPCCL